MSRDPSKPVTPTRLLTAWLLVGFLCWWTGASLAPSWIEQYRSGSWPSTEGTIVECTPVSRLSPLKRSKLKVAYRYTVSGRELTGTRHHAIAFAFSNWWYPSAESYAADHPTSSRVTVWYDPDDPSRSLLDRGSGVADGLEVGLLAAAGAAALIKLARVTLASFRPNSPH